MKNLSQGIPEDQTQQHFKTESWRNKQKDFYTQTLQNILKKYSHSQIGTLHIKEIKEKYNPSIEGCYFLFTSIASEKVQVYEIIWNPITLELTWSIVLVRNQKEGIGTKLKEMTEEIAQSLHAKTLLCEGIFEEHIEFWKKQPDYVFGPIKNDAIKYY